MLKNNVFRMSVSTSKWIKAASIRAVRTMAQTAIPMIPVGISITAIDWKVSLGVIVSAGIVSLLMSVTGIPEVPEEIGNTER